MQEYPAKLALERCSPTTWRVAIQLENSVVQGSLAALSVTTKDSDAIGDFVGKEPITTLIASKSIAVTVVEYRLSWAVAVPLKRNSRSGRHWLQLVAAVLIQIIVELKGLAIKAL